MVPICSREILHHTSRAYEAFKNYRNANSLVIRTATLALDILVTVGHFITSIPKKVVHLSLLGLNVIGYLYLIDQVQDLIKTAYDLSYAVRRRDSLAIFILAVKVTTKALDILLMAANGAGAIMALAGAAPLLPLYYAILRPIGIFSFVIGAGTMAYDLYENTKLYRTISLYQVGIEHFDRRVAVMQSIVALQLNRGRTHIENADPLAMRAIRQLSTSQLSNIVDNCLLNSLLETWNGEEELSDSQKAHLDSLYYHLLENIDSALWYKGSSATLIGVGYVALAIRRILAYSPWQWCCDTTMAFLWWLLEVHAYIKSKMEAVINPRLRLT